MFTVDLERVISEIVRSELIGKGRDGEALYLNFDARMYYRAAGKEFRTSAGIHLLYSLPPGMSYVTVFSGVTDNSFDNLKDVSEWKHEATHDSCWRDINVIRQMYFAMADEINAQLKVDGRKQIAPNQMDGQIYFPHGLYQWVPVRVSKDPTDEYNYRQTVTLL